MCTSDRIITLCECVGVSECAEAWNSQDAGHGVVGSDVSYVFRYVKLFIAQDVSDFNTSNIPIGTVILARLINFLYEV